MITEKNIRKIPKYMLDKIRKQDLIEHPEQNKKTRFYKYFNLYKNELCEVTVAVKNYHKKWYCKQVIVHGIHNKYAYLQDIGRTMVFYRVGWFREGLTKFETWYDYDWGYIEDKYFNLYATVINKEFIETIPKYKYSAIKEYNYIDLLNYLRMYEKYPQTELLVKAGLSNLATSKMILKECDKDKKFCKWLYQNKDMLNKKSYYKDSIIKAYKQNKNIEEIYKFDSFKKHFAQKDNFIVIKDFLKSGEKEKFIHYLINQNTDGYCYTDYLNACNYLNIDMNIDKNRYPHNFNYWHNMRIDQYHTEKAKKDKEAKAKLINDFMNVANKYVSLQRNLKDDYITIIAKSPQDLINEGELLQHCVGRMNYDQKFAREETLIFFIRNKQTPSIPLVTVEYDLNRHIILQCYGDKDSTPNNSILDYVNKVWLPYANRKIKAIA